MFTELDIFIGKFKQIWKSGQSAHLHIETNDGQAWVGLRVHLGQAPGPLHQGPHQQVRRRTRDGPSCQRRRAKRAAEREAGKATNTEEVSEGERTFCEDVEAVEASNAFAAEKVEEMNLAEQVKEIFPCDICDFCSNWENGLAIHMPRKHAKIDQLDGSSSIKEESDENDVYAATIRYWKEGILGTVFQSFLDATKVIEESDLSDKFKDVEKAKVLEARKQAFGSDFVHFPPWRKK